MNSKFDTNSWTADRVAVLRRKVTKPTQRFRDFESERDPALAERVRKARRGSEKLRDAILKYLANRHNNN